LTLNVAAGDVGGSSAPLRFTATANTGADRTETIVVQAGRLFMEILVTQIVPDIEILNISDFYPLTGANCTFTVKSKYPWRVRVEEDTHNIVTLYDLEGEANMSGTTFNFTLIDAVLDNLREENAKFTFYSETGEFEPVSVDIRGLNYFDIAGLWVYPVDQPTGEMWYTYANVPGTTNSFDIPPAGYQDDPPRANSCAALPRGDGSQWRLPVLAELHAISTAVGSNYAAYGFDSGYYWSATSGSGLSLYVYIVDVSTDGQDRPIKMHTDNRARCVRSK
jgi:hypothetical protein